MCVVWGHVYEWVCFRFTYKEYTHEQCIMSLSVHFSWPHSITHTCTLSLPSSQSQETNMLITTILDVQPRLASAGGGKTNDEIVAELAESILGKLPEKLDPDNGLPELFEPNAKGIINSLSTVLLQEIDRFNRLLKVIKVRVI